MRAARRQARQQRAERRDARAALDVECPRCGAVWGVSRQEVIAGTWRRCPRCDAPPEAEPDDGEDVR